ncbi:hypothetical protein ACFPMF_23980 [Larkinella bovis]|uniref:YD repeat-containing protein n=1 Tax=Larkinella bovis TaxID=683041 RepID=A0ABW0IFY3_9BACT
MRTFYLFRTALFLLIATCLYSCDDHRIPTVTPGSNADKLRVKSITQQLADISSRVAAVQKVSVFSYDTQGRLSGITTSPLPADPTAPVENSTYSYDAQNRLTQLRRVISQTGANPDPEETYTYTYNHAGQVSQLDYINNTRDDMNKWQVTFTYTPGNQLLTSFRSFSWFPVSYSEGIEYTFTGKNVTKAFLTATETRAPASSSTGTRTTLYTYDTKKNPFYGVFVIPAPYPPLSNPISGIFHYYTYYGGFDNLFNLSENNALSAGSTTYAYTYNVANLPLTRTTTADGKVTETLTYEYESY